MVSVALIMGVLAVAATASSSIRDNLLLEREKAARQWAPLVWLHPEEHFYPSSVDYFLQHVKPSKAANMRPRNILDEEESANLMSSLPVGRPSQESFLLAPHNFKCSDCPLPKFLFGKKPGGYDSPPVYVTIHSCSMPPTRRESRSNHGLDFDHYDFLNDREETEKALPLQTERLTGHQATEPISTAPTETLGISSSASKHIPFMPLLTSFTNQREKNVQDSFRHLSDSSEQTAGNLMSSNLSYLITSSGPFEHSTDTPLNDTLSDNSHERNPSDNRIARNTFVNTMGAATSYVNPAITIQENTAHPNTNDQISISGSTTGQFSPEATTIRVDAGSKTHNFINSDNEVFTTINPFTQLIDPETYTVGVKKGSTSSLSKETNQNDNSYQEVNIPDDQQTSNIPKAPELYHTSEKRHTPEDPVNNSVPYEQQFTITYWMFYPYNKGKDICSVNYGYFLGRALKPRVNGVCHGEAVTFGDHVGDWEHVSIQFKANTPIQMYVSSHTFGAYYTYDPHRREFLYTGEDSREGIPMSPNYPRNVQLTGSHPILYAAQGSHGLWGSPGIHRYNSLPLLQDKTSMGTAWETWLNMDLIDLKDSLAMAQPHRHWLLYEGYWGNPGTRCHILMAGFCEFAKGPTGIIRKRVNFPCQNITVTSP